MQVQEVNVIMICNYYFMRKLTSLATNNYTEIIWSIFLFPCLSKIYSNHYNSLQAFLNLI